MSKKSHKKSPQKPAKKPAKKSSLPKVRPSSKPLVKTVPKKSAKPAKPVKVAPKAAKPAKPAPAAKATKPVKAAPPAKAAPTKPAPPAAKAGPGGKAVPPVAPTPAAVPAAVPAKESAARASLRSRILAQSRAKAPGRPIAFSLDEAHAAAVAAAKIEDATKVEAAKVAAKTARATNETLLNRAVQPKHVKAASLADILGFNPKQSAAPTPDDDHAIPDKFRRHYRQLLDLRLHLTGQLDQHTEDTLKRSSKDDAGDLSGYGQHMADAGTDTFDRDFALSMVANEQEALSEIEAAIQRVKNGTYGLCEVTQKPIARERLLAVPFTRYSAEALKEIEKNRLRSRSSVGLSSELSDGESLAGTGSSGDED